MLLTFTALDQSLQFREFCCHMPELDSALDLLNRITAKGDTLLHVQLADEGSHMQLPTEAFDGEPMSEALQHLKQQWLAVLDDLVPSCAEDVQENWHLELTRRRIRVYENRINLLTNIVKQIEQFVDRVETTTHREPQRTRLLNRYSTTLAMYQRQIVQAQTSKRQAQEKLTQLVSV